MHIKESSPQNIKIHKYINTWMNTWTNCKIVTSIKIPTCVTTNCKNVESGTNAEKNYNDDKEIKKKN